VATIRPPAVAGTFYPADAVELESLVRSLLAAAAGRGSSGPGAKAVIAPHAGYQYSGPIAASAFAELARPPAGASGATGVERVVLMGPSHFVPVRGLALPGDDELETPLGTVEVDDAGRRAVAALPQVTVSRPAHAQEHSLEVELPFLQLIFPAARVLPLVVGEAAPEEVADVLETVWGGAETRVVVSSDLSHYLPYETARETDRETAETVLRLEGPLSPLQACGAHPINGLLVAARRRGLRAQLLDLRSSGDTAGDRRRVVGYGAFAFA
jgi:hypothetical protein